MMKYEPYWWEEAPPSSNNPVVSPPAQADVVIVGAGYTGLTAALFLARAGRSVVLVDKMRPGEGASTRNGGITSGNIRPSMTELTRKFGRDQAHRILNEAKDAREHLSRFIAEEGIACDLSNTGRFYGAMTESQYDSLARDADFLAKELGIVSYAVPRAEQHGYLGTDFYRGGSVRMDIGGLHPSKFHAELLRLATQAGAIGIYQTQVRKVVENGAGHDVITDRGTIRARDVLIATNGYTDASDPWLRRRLIPVRSRIVATAELPAELMARLMPRLMMVTDTRNMSYYYRPSPDGKRVLFGGRDGSRDDRNLAAAIEFLRGKMIGVFPELAGTPLSHSWYGYVAMHLDMVPRIFTRNGAHYATGYCGSGVVWAPWLGRKVAEKILGKGDSSALDFRPPWPLPFYEGRPWFLPGVMAWYEMGDRRLRR